MATHERWKACFAAAAVLAGIAVAGAVSAQQTPEERQEQQFAISSFYQRFVAPLDACAVADTQALEKARGLVGAVREKYARTFQVVERHPVYATTVRNARAAADRMDHYRGPKRYSESRALLLLQRGVLGSADGVLRCKWNPCC